MMITKARKNSRKPIFQFMPSLLLIASLSILYTSIAHASLLTLDSTAKGMISDGSCFGVSGVIRDGTPDCVSPDFFAVLNRQPPNQEERGVAEFDISSITTEVSSAFLYSGVNLFSSSTDRTLNLYGRAADGSVTLSDFYFDNGDLIDTFVHSAGDEWLIDVTTLINDLVFLDQDHAGFLLLQIEQTAGRKVWDGPQLIIEFADVPVPEPGTLALIGLGFAAMGFRKRKTYC